MPTRSELEHVLAIDPGERVGWASAHVGLNRLEDIEHGVLEMDEFIDWFEFKQNMLGRATFCKTFDRVVYETWLLTSNRAVRDSLIGNPLLSVQLIGQIRLVCRYTHTPITTYGPDRKEVWTATMAPEVSARFEDSSEQHDKDALMHLWGYYWENYFDPTKEPA